MTTKPTDPEEIFKICSNHWSDDIKPKINCNACLAVAINNLRAVVAVMYDELKELRAQTEDAFAAPTVNPSPVIEHVTCSHPTLHDAHIWVDTKTNATYYCLGV